MAAKRTPLGKIFDPKAPPLDTWPRKQKQVVLKQDGEEVPIVVPPGLPEREWREEDGALDDLITTLVEFRNSLSPSERECAAFSVGSTQGVGSLWVGVVVWPPRFRNEGIPDE